MNKKTFIYVVLAMFISFFIGLWGGIKVTQESIEARAKMFHFTEKEETIIEIIIFGEPQL